PAGATPRPRPAPGRGSGVADGSLALWVSRTGEGPAGSRTDAACTIPDYATDPAGRLHPTALLYQHPHV
ncbi:hypothetical protein ABZZ19_32500, partial [Streptomyces sp. NPDC006341]